MYQPCATRLTNRRADECERYAGASRWMRPKVNSAIDSQAPNGSSHASPRALLETPCKECNCTNSSSTGTFYEHNNQHPLSIICSLSVHQERVQSMAQCTMAQALKEFGIKDFVPLLPFSWIWIVSDRKYLRTIFCQFHFLSNIWEQVDFLNKEKI